MNIDKSTKRIAKRVSKGFQGYPLVTLSYYGPSPELATEVVISFTAAEGDDPQEQKLKSESDVKKDEVIQTTLLKIIERADAKSVVEVEGVAPNS